MKIEEIKIGSTYWWINPINKSKSGFVKVLSIDKDTNLLTCEKKTDKKKDICEKIDDIFASDLKKTFTTVGELIEKLKEYDQNMGVELYVSCHTGDDNNNYTSMRKDIWNDTLDKGTIVCVDTDENVVRISNNNTEDYLLDDC